MKISWFSNAPWAATGYGNQTRLFAPRIRGLGHEISITALFGLQGGIMYWDGIPVYPNYRHMYGLDVMDAHAHGAGADVIISLFDVWPIDPRAITLPWYPWFPIDHEPIPQGVAQVVRHAAKGITMSQFGQQQAEAAGLDTWYVPHGVETGVFRPLDRAQARAHLNLPADAFIVGMVAANKGVPPRKAFFEQIAAFRALKQKHSDALLYLHTYDGTNGGECVNLVEFCHVLGLRPLQDVVFCNQDVNRVGFNDQYMTAMYNALDVMTMVSKGEGFGIPLIEAQACGCPVITGEWTSMGELCGSGWRIPKTEAEPSWELQGAFQWQVHTGAVVERMLAAYEMRGNDDYRRRARDWALGYDADKVAEKYWKPVLDGIAERLADDGERMQLVKL